MSIAFATKLSSLRREKNISQKAVADALGISQALLSHYEKGIRECNLDFLVKAADYYDVTTDYLLGRTESRHGNNSVFEEEEIESDYQLKDITVLRSFMYLLNESEKSVDANNSFNSFFALSIKKYLSITNERNTEILPILDAVQNSMLSENQQFIEAFPVHINTVNTESLKIIAEKINEILK